LSDDIPSFLPYSQRLEAVAWARGEYPDLSSERMRRYLRLGATLGETTCIAWAVIDGDQERCGAILGGEPYAVAACSAPSPEDESDSLVVPSRIAQGTWGEHPIVARLAENETLYVRRVSVERGGSTCEARLYLASKKERWEKSGLEALDDLSQLMSDESAVIEERIDIVKQRVRATVEVAKLFDNIDEQHWLYRQMARQMPHRGLFVFDPQLNLRLVAGTIAMPGALGKLADPVGRNLTELGSDDTTERLVAECRKTLDGPESAILLDCDGRHFEIQTTPIKDRRGTVRFGMGMVHDITEESERFALEQLLSARLRALVDSLDAAVLVEDERRVAQHCNQQFCDLLLGGDSPASVVGCSSAELIRRMSPRFFIPEAVEEGIEEAVLTHQTQSNEIVYLADMRILERSYAPLDVDGRHAGHLWTYRDVTTRESNKDLLQRQADELRALSLVDELTGLYNRRGFLTLATQQLKLCDRSMRPAMVIFVDLDGMKRINDELGHEYGDQALIETASVLRQCFRYSDVVARLGGDEFVVLAVEADPPTGDLVEARLYAKLDELNRRPGRAFELQFSVGIAGYDPSKSEMVEEVLARADALMYDAKRLRGGARTA
jgi:diguanylate cyclase (GGDEF)-like protein